MNVDGSLSNPLRPPVEGGHAPSLGHGWSGARLRAGGHLRRKRLEGATLPRRKRSIKSVDLPGFSFLRSSRGSGLQAALFLANSAPQVAKTGSKA